MPKSVVELRPNKKVTDFFQRKAEPILQQVASERQSTISFSSDEVVSVPNPSKKTSKTSSSSQCSVPLRTPIPEVTLVASQNASSRTHRATSNAPGSPNAVSNLNTKSVLTPLVTTLASPRTGQKRKKELIIISSEESDDASPVFPVIHVKPSSARRSTAPQPSFSQALSAIPLTPRQNLQTPSPRPMSLKVLPSSQPPKSLSQNSQRTPVTLSKHRPSPPKRPRYDSSRKEVSSALDCDADDEGEPKHLVVSRKASPKSLNVGRIVDSTAAPMNVDAITPFKLFTVTSVLEEYAEADAQQPPNPRNEVLPSSQQGEIELLIDDEMGDRNSTNECQDLPSVLVPMPSTSANITPTRARTYAIIADIRAKAEARAAAEAEKDRKLFECGLTSDGDNSELSSLSNTTEDEDGDDDHLNLKIEDALPAKRPLPKFTVDLLDDDLFTSAATRKVVPKAKATVCPLDVMIKDDKRERSRKALIESKRKSGEVLSSDVLLDGDPPWLEFPQKSTCRAGSENIEVQGLPSPGTMMNEFDRDKLLGREDSEAVGKILENDRKRDVEVEKNSRHNFTFWCESMMTVEDVVPTFPTQNGSNPFLVSFYNAMNRREYSTCSLLLDSGVLAQVPATQDLTAWLFATAMSTSHSELSLAAYRCLLNIYRHTHTLSNLKLTSETLLAPLLKLGVNELVISLLGCKAKHLVQVTSDLKVELVHRFVTMSEVLGCSHSVDASGIPVLIAVLVSVSFDIASLHLQQDIAYAIEALLSNSDITASIELETCSILKRLATSSFMSNAMQADVFLKLIGGNPSSSRIRRWLGWALLGGRLDVEGSQWDDVPPFSLFLNLFDREASGTIKLFIHKETDYEELGSFVEILAVALTDIESYMRKESNSASLEKICKLLEKLMGKIVDTRAAHLDRTKTKDAINRLHKRLIYQRDAAIKAKRNGKTGKLEQYFTRTKPQIAA